MVELLQQRDKPRCNATFLVFRFKSCDIFTPKLIPLSPATSFTVYRRWLPQTGRCEVSSVDVKGLPGTFGIDGQRLSDVNLITL